MRLVKVSETVPSPQSSPRKRGEAQYFMQFFDLESWRTASISMSATSGIENKLSGLNRAFSPESFRGCPRFTTSNPSCGGLVMRQRLRRNTIAKFAAKANREFSDLLLERSSLSSLDCVDCAVG